MANVVGWRIVKEKHARSAFSGEGARIFEGRWNSAGVRMVYCSEHVSLAALEILVHTQPVTIPDKFRVFRVSWDGKMMITIDLKKLPRGWNAQPPSSFSKNVGDNWVRAGHSVVLAVPSVCTAAEKPLSREMEHSNLGNMKSDDPGSLRPVPRLC